MILLITTNTFNTAMKFIEASLQTGSSQGWSEVSSAQLLNYSLDNHVIRKAGKKISLFCNVQSTSGPQRSHYLMGTLAFFSGG
jgi:hypothetical protein